MENKLQTRRDATASWWSQRKPVRSPRTSSAHRIASRRPVRCERPRPRRGLQKPVFRLSRLADGRTGGETGSKRRGAVLLVHAAAAAADSSLVACVFAAAAAVAADFVAVVCPSARHITCALTVSLSSLSPFSLAVRSSPPFQLSLSHGVVLSSSSVHHIHRVRDSRPDRTFRLMDKGECACV